MTKSPIYPSDKADQFMVRLPDGLREKIKLAAKAASRSMNAEIVARLEGYPMLLESVGTAIRDLGQLRAEKERLESEIDQLESVKTRFFEKDGSEKPVLTLPQSLLNRIILAAERNHRTIDSEAIAALEIAFPPDAIDIDILSAFLQSLVGVSAPDGDKGYLSHINDALAKAKQPWTVAAGWDGEIRFYPYASPQKDGDEEA